MVSLSRRRSCVRFIAAGTGVVGDNGQLDAQQLSFETDLLLERFCE